MKAVNQSGRTIKCGKQLISLDKPMVMGIINVTPDSFYSKSRKQVEYEIVNQAGKMLDEGAAFIDIGGFSSRPGADMISTEEEISRIIPAVKALVKAFPDIRLSVDTFRAAIADAAVAEGAAMINDISGGDDDPAMFDTIAKLKVPYVLMHKQGSIQKMQDNPVYEDVTAEIIRSFSEKLATLHQKGVADIIIDPGFGFGKTLAHNYCLLNELEHFSFLDCPLLIGISRKSMINQVLNTKAEEALNGTTVLHTIALLKGCNILRVHDVKEAVEAIKLTTHYTGYA